MEKPKNTSEKEHSYFLSLELENLNCFKDKQILDLSDGNNNYSPWTIILGDNGTGKTTLLKVLDRMQPMEYPFSFKKYNINLEGNYYLPYFVYGGITKDRDFNPYNNNQIVKLKIVNNSSLGEIYTGNNTSNDKVYLFSERQTNVFILSYGASRKMSKSQSLNSSVSKYNSTLFENNIDLINAEEWFLQKEWAVLKSENKTKKKFKKEFDLVRDILLEILPDVKDIISKTINEDNSKPKIDVETVYGWVNIKELSYGYQTITALIVDIAANMMEKYPESENPLSEPVIILIDEIDLHLHPKWQRTVIEKFSKHFPKAQFIVTAHSPLIVQAAEGVNANIVVCRKEEDRVIIDNNPDNVKGWRVDQILTSDLFEVESSQSIEIEKLRNEKIKILLKNELSDSDKERLDFINEKLKSNPVFSSKESINAEELIKKAAELLNK